MIKNILISKSKRKITNQYNKFIGMSGENLQEVLVFNLDEELEGQGIIEIKFPDGTTGFIEIEKTELGYELPVKSSLLTQKGELKMQLRILQNNQEVFKSEIMEFRVKESINATENIPDEYPTWIDNLTTLKQNLEKSEQERVTSEKARVEAEEQREETFTQMEEFQIERIIELMIQDIEDLDYRLKEFTIDDLDYTITINTEIDLEKLQCETVTVPDMKFTFTKQD